MRACARSAKNGLCEKKRARVGNNNSNSSNNNNSKLINRVRLGG